MDGASFPHSTEFGTVHSPGIIGLQLLCALASTANKEIIEVQMSKRPHCIHIFSVCFSRVVFHPTLTPALVPGLLHKDGSEVLNWRQATEAAKPSPSSVHRGVPCRFLSLLLELLAISFSRELSFGFV